MNKALLFLCSLFFPFLVLGQVGGDNIYEFLNLSSSARVTGLGGNLITIKDDDIALALANPSVLNPSMHQAISFNHNFHLAGIQHGFVNYGHQIKAWKINMHGGVQYTSYGKFKATNEQGNITGNFKAAEYAIILGAAHQLYENLSVGANLKFISSQFEGYNSTGFATDLAAFYQDSSKSFSATLVVKNLGLQLSAYEGSNKEKLPLDLQFGISKKLKYLPFRFSIIAHNIQRWNILYDDPNKEETTLLFGDEQGNAERSKTSIFFDNLFRHFIFNGEFLFGRKENFRLRIGYSHFQRKELSVENFRSLAGFSLGVGFKVNRFRIDYGRSFYHIAGGVNHFSISTNLREFRR